MSTFKRSISLLLVLGILLGVLAPAAQAAPVKETATVDTGDVTIDGTNGFGDLLAQEITENQQENVTENEGYPGGYTVADLKIVDNVATVTYDTLEEAILVVALHTEDGMQLITSATVTVTPDATEAVVTFEGEMPEYFLASAYLLNQYDYSPLCASYDTPMYTREMQELLASTVEDYDPEKVLNLDDDETTNFAVYADSTIVIEPVEGKNIVASIDNENATYVIKNADEQMLSLQVGDILAYAYDKNELLIVRVGSIEVNGTTVTIIGAELEMSEAFEAVKIDGIGDNENIVVDDSTAGEGISYVGLVEDDGVSNPNSVEGGDTTTLKHKFEIKIKSKADDGHTSASLAVSGSLDLALDVSVKYYISTTQKYVEFKLSPHLTFSLGVQESLTLSEEMGYLAVSPVPGVYVGFEPELQLKLDCKTDFKATLKSVIGFKYDTSSGVQNISKKPELDVGIDVEGTIFLGVDFCPQVAIVSDKLSEIEVNMLVGFELEAKASGKAFEAYKKDADEYHECQECIAMDVHVKAKIGGTLKFLDQDWLSVSITIGEWKHKLGEMYYSLDKDEFGIGACPNKLFRVTVQVKDREYNPISGETVTVSTLDEALTTDENGLAVFYTPEEELVVRAEKDGYFSAENVRINKARKIVLCLIYQLDSGDNGGSVGGSEPGNPFEGIDFGIGDDNSFVDHGSIDASGMCGNDLTWTLYSVGTLVISGTGEMNDFTSVSNVPWHEYRQQIKSVIIENGVTSIGSEAFRKCGNLDKVVIPGSITKCSMYAFADCPKLITAGGTESGCNIEFGWTSEIPDRALYGCNSLTTLQLPEGITMIGASSFSRCGQLRSLTIPDTVTSIGDFAFYRCYYLLKVNIGENVKSIGEYAFCECYDLISVNIPDSVINIGDYVFYECSSLTSVTIGENVTSIGVSAFSYCGDLVSVTLGKNVMSIGDSAFAYCVELMGVTIPNSVITIGVSSFEYCYDLEYVTIGENVTSIGNRAFSDCDSLINVTIPNSVTTIGKSAFYGCDSLMDVMILDGVAFIGDRAFYSCSNLINIEIPNTITSINDYTFAYCYDLKSVTIPASISYIGSSAFGDCNSLTSVTFEGNAPTIEPSFAFSRVTATAYYPANNPTWTSEVMQNYGGTITWVPYTPSEGSSIIGELTQISAQKLAMELEAVYGGEYDTEITEEATIKTASFNDLVPNEQYVLLAMASIEVEDPLASDNLLFIDQAAAAEDGTLTFRYVQRTPCDISYVVACGASHKNLNDAEISFPEMVADGELQVVDPVVVYDGETLIEGRDYVIVGKVDFTEAGEYTCYIRGIHNYAGLVECTYTVAEHEHSFTNYVSDGNATCTEDGTKTAKCDHCDLTDTIADVGSALGHNMGAWNTVRSATCTENGEEQRNCTRCDHSESRTIEAVGHRWDNGVVTREPTEDTEGERLYTCTACGATRTESIPVIGHEHRYEAVVTAPTCTERGYTTYTCKCGESYVADYVAALGHSFGEWVVIKEPTTTEDGLEERSCTRCAHTEQRTIPKLENPFNDVAPGSFFYEPVMWAVENGITNGTSATTFGPNDQCMRAHVVTFLWRTVGSPEPKLMVNPFVDVKPTDFYYKPVLWALENGITSGMDATHFGPTAYCNRAQVVTFLYRTMDSPDVGAATNPFTDVAAGSFYEKPVLWAVENGVTAGLSATSFGPNSICNRAQIVTFLYRAFVD